MTKINAPDWLIKKMELGAFGIQPGDDPTVTIEGEIIRESFKAIKLKWTDGDGHWWSKWFPLSVIEILDE